MKRNLLLITCAVVALTLNAQKVWNFSNDPFGANGMTGGSAALTFTSNIVYDGITFGTNGTALWNLTANNKTIDGTAYTHRMQTGGGGAPVAPSKLPTTRYISFNVGGASEIKIGMTTSSTGAARTLILVNENETFLDSITNVDPVQTYTYNYTGGATKLYLYSRSSGINMYYISATNVVASVNPTMAEKGVSISRSEILNPNKVALEVYNVTGKKVHASTENISLANFNKGVYVVKVAGSTGSLKFSI